MSDIGILWLNAQTDRVGVRLITQDIYSILDGRIVSAHRKEEYSGGEVLDFDNFWIPLHHDWSSMQLLRSSITRKRH